MTEAISAVQPLQKFTTLQYTTKDGENITATKNDGIVTLSGDKNGIRQIPVEEFIKKELPENVKEIKLERSPEVDTVEISKKDDVAEEEPKAQKEEENPEEKTDSKNSETKQVGKNLDVAA